MKTNTLLFFALPLVMMVLCIQEYSNAFTTEQSDHGKVLLVKKSDNAEPTVTINHLHTSDPFNWSREVLAGRIGKPEMLEDDTFLDMALSGIIWNRSTPMAVIDNTLLHEGDSIHDVIIDRINKNSVFLVKGTKRYTLHFEEFFID